MRVPFALLYWFQNRSCHQRILKVCATEGEDALRWHKGISCLTEGSLTCLRYLPLHPWGFQSEKQEWPEREVELQCKRILVMALANPTGALTPLGFIRVAPRWGQNGWAFIPTSTGHWMWAAPRRVCSWSRQFYSCARPKRGSSWRLSVNSVLNIWGSNSFIEGRSGERNSLFISVPLPGMSFIILFPNFYSFPNLTGHTQKH